MWPRSMPRASSWSIAASAPQIDARLPQPASAGRARRGTADLGDEEEEVDEVLGGNLLKRLASSGPVAILTGQVFSGRRAS